MVEKDNFFVKNKSIITFLILEVVALTAFNFGNISYIFGLAGFLLALVGAFFGFEVIKDKKELERLYKEGAKKAEKVAAKTYFKAMKKVGFVL